jgi:hypothetical protein
MDATKELSKPPEKIKGPSESIRATSIGHRGGPTSRAAGTWTLSCSAEYFSKSPVGFGPANLYSEPVWHSYPRRVSLSYHFIFIFPYDIVPPEFYPYRRTPIPPFVSYLYATYSLRLPSVVCLTNH